MQVTREQWLAWGRGEWHFLLWERRDDEVEHQRKRGKARFTQVTAWSATCMHTAFTEC